MQTPQQISETDILTVENVAKFLKVSDDTIYELVHRGEIPYRKVGKQIRFPGWLIIDWLNTGS